MSNPTGPMPPYGTPDYERWYAETYPQQYAQLPQSTPPAKKRHPIRWTIAGIIGVIVVVSIATNTGGKKHDASTAGGNSPSAAATQHADVRAPATKVAAAHSSKYDRYVALSKTAGFTEPGTEKQAKELADEVCSMSQADMRAVLAGIDSEHRDIAGFIVRGYCPDSYPRLKAARASLNRPKPAPKPALTTSEEQAIESANSYLTMGGFSRAGLIKQLTSKYGEGFSAADATFAVDHVKADWNAQAVESAKSYLQMGGFSRAGLIKQLTSPYGEQFTLAQATYAVDHVGL